METNKSLYEQYQNDVNRIWRNRLVWREDGEFAKNDISIINFCKETNVFNTISSIKNSKDFYKEIKKIADKYVKWCESKHAYYKENAEELTNFFKGAIGEYFFTVLLHNVKTFEIKEDDTYLHRYDFDYVAPILDVTEDFGADLTGVLYTNNTNNNESYNCVIQVKFWNPHTNKQLTKRIANDAFADGVINNYIDPYQNKNVVICWLGTDKKVSKWLKRNTKMYKHMVFIDNDVLDKCINNKMPHFWDKLITELQQIQNFK